MQSIVCPIMSSSRFVTSYRCFSKAETSLFIRIIRKFRLFFLSAVPPFRQARISPVNRRVNANLHRPIPHTKKPQHKPLGPFQSPIITPALIHQDGIFHPNLKSPQAPHTSHKHPASSTPPPLHSDQSPPHRNYCSYSQLT